MKISSACVNCSKPSVSVSHSFLLSSTWSEIKVLNKFKLDPMMAQDEKSEDHQRDPPVNKHMNLIS